MNFKVLKEDEHSFKVQHPDGSDFVIAKAGLDDKVMKKIKGYATGGNVEAGGAGDVQSDPNAEDTSDSMANSGWKTLSDAAIAQNMKARQEFVDAQTQQAAGNYGPMGALGERAAASTVRTTPSGKLLGTVDPESMQLGKSAIAGDLEQQASARGLNYSPNQGLPNQAQAPTNNSDLSVLDLVKARYGDDISDAGWNKLQNQADKSNYSYVPITLKNKVTGFYPNFNATPTGEIGDPKNFTKLSSDDSKSVWMKDPFSWIDQKYGASKQLLEKHAAAGIPAKITTASDLIAHDDYVNAIPQGSSVNIVLPHPIGENSDSFQNGTGLPSNQRLLIAADKLKQSGITTKVSVPTTSGKLNTLDDFSLNRLKKDYNAQWSPDEASGE